jgi:hypothetical protein
VLPEAVIDRAIPWQQEVPLDGILEALRVSPLLTDGRAKLCRFAVCAERVRPGSNVLESKNLESLR